MEVHLQNNSLSPAVHFDYAAKLKTLLVCKERFLENNEDPRSMPFLRTEVAKSWIMSRSNGVNPENKTVGHFLQPTELKAISDQNRLLIDISIPLINSFKDLLSGSGYVLGLTDSTGVFLFIEGEEAAVSYLQNINAAVGSVWREETSGTVAHILSIIHKRPFQLLGPEHYCDAFSNIVGSAAPIFDNEGNVIGTLALSQPFPDSSWEDHFDNLHLHSLHFTTALAAAIEAEFKLTLSNNDLQAMNHCLQATNKNLIQTTNTLETVLSNVDDGYLTIDSVGRIIHINNEASKILKLIPEELKNRNINIREYLGTNSSLLKAFNKREQINYFEEPIFVDGVESPCVICVQPIKNDSGTYTDGAIIRISHVEKINALVTNRSGAVANYTFGDLLGDSREFIAIKKLCQRFSQTKETILLTGESGTGKELFAQAIHNAYQPNGPFIAINCAAMPRELIESELFGYEGGSFTGAERGGRPGKIELANGGTLFLDEIGDMPFELQAVLLRVLEDKQVIRVGGRTYKKVDFRVISATNKDLAKIVSEKCFREDLFYRLSVLSIQIPALRYRGNDVTMLSKYFVENYCFKLGRETMKISLPALKKLNEYSWPGNVRQLENAMIFAVNYAQKEVIEINDLPAYMFADSPDSPLPTPEEHFDGESLKKLQEEVVSIAKLERAAIEDALKHTRFNIPLAANLLGLSKSTMYRKLREYNIKR